MDDNFLIRDAVFFKVYKLLRVRKLTYKKDRPQVNADGHLIELFVTIQ